MVRIIHTKVMKTHSNLYDSYVVHQRVLKRSPQYSPSCNHRTKRLLNINPVAGLEIVETILIQVKWYSFRTKWCHYRVGARVRFVGFYLVSFWKVTIRKAFCKTRHGKCDGIVRRPPHFAEKNVNRNLASHIARTGTAKWSFLW